ncbi:MAG: sulfurtransferase TusA family protein [Pseudomonadales bacterium]
MSDPHVLDVRGLLCPLPVIRTQDLVKTLAAGSLIEVLATDPGVLQDIPAWCRVHGHELVSTQILDNPQGSDAAQVLVVRLRVQRRAGANAP